MEEKKDIYDLIIVGGGPGGMSAALYASRYKLKTALFADKLGGDMLDAHFVENYPGVKGKKGMDLAEDFIQQLKSIPVDVIENTVKGLQKQDQGRFKVTTSNNKEYYSKTIILANGLKRRRLALKEAEDYAGKGVHYCATCDAFFYADKVVGVIGGNDSAVTSAIYLADIAKKVYLIYRRENIRSEPIYLDVIEKNSKIEIIRNKVVSKLEGDPFLQKIYLKEFKDEDNLDAPTEELAIDGIFIEIGSVPSYALFEQIGVKTTEKGFVLVNESQETSVPGVYAAGDISSGSAGFRQIATACSEAIIAARSSYIYIKKNTYKESEIKNKRTTI